ncbi:uncharacterized protein LY89DRAFT_588749 [Mollisia scopiformis]|uniref:Uncharacterized protein n=1 Tax=Mollisia scopiformis TaxID=149040 RepID=A0A194X463_MOLSC|nr:uncharacterized protein LY89DRAFT_588749 [Mollisia scopiformis]KUJ14966.1 hypothetical protein LY89DRAFT_588749 [Mollisia scopiformis]
MQLQSVLFSLFLATAVVAKGDGNKTLSTAGECKEMKSLNKLVELASNTTKLDKVTKNNATKIAEIQAKASDASTQLDTLQSNSTLMSACAVIDAEAAEEDQCQETFCKFMDGLQKFVDVANNQTKLDKLTDGNTTKEADIKAKAATAQTKLTAMQSNSTLVSACDALKTSKDGTSTSASSAASTTTAAAKSAAMILKGASAGGAVLSTLIAVSIGMFML